MIGGGQCWPQGCTSQVEEEAWAQEGELEGKQTYFKGKVK